jgi:hypothetical protein
MKYPAGHSSNTVDSGTMDSGGANPASAMENPGATLMYIRTPRKDPGFAPPGTFENARED